MFAGGFDARLVLLLSLPRQVGFVQIESAFFSSSRFEIAGCRWSVSLRVTFMMRDAHERNVSRMKLR
jgi:hypothetical protein